MMDKTEALLKELTEANGVSGYESEIRAIMARELKPLSDRIEYDKLGSIMGVKRGTTDSPRVMVAGHMDEIGFMVREITPEGYIKFLPLGGWWGHVALGQRMRVITSKGPVLGVIGARPPHLLQPAEREKVLSVKELFLDVGVVEKYDVKAKLGIKVGDPIVPDSQFTKLANPNMYMAKAFDNRSACAVVVDALRR
jgi:endoglucanase